MRFAPTLTPAHRLQSLVCLRNPQEHFHPVILTAKEDSKNTNNGRRLIDLKIKNRPVLRDPAKIRKEFAPKRPLKRRPSERLHITFDRSDPRCCSLKRLIWRIAEVLIGFEKVIENQ